MSIERTTYGIPILCCLCGRDSSECPCPGGPITPQLRALLPERVKRLEEFAETIYLLRLNIQNEGLDKFEMHQLLDILAAKASIALGPEHRERLLAISGHVEAVHAIAAQRRQRDA